LLGTYEKIQTVEFLRCSEGAKVLWDLGAHVGYYSLLFNSVQPAGRIVAFEPVERNMRMYKQHMELNEVDVYSMNQVAVSDKEGTLSFNVSRTTVAGKLSPDGTSLVKVIKLSSWFNESHATPPDIIKIDIEGEEFKVLQDIREILLRYRPRIFLSTHGPVVHEECIRLLRGLGYDLRPLDNARLEVCGELLAF
jgi:FkbM family methyltransferase